MNERDRLAVDLAALNGAGGAAELADLLIALGWTRLDEDRLARALAPLLPQHREGIGGYPHQSSHRTWTVYDFMTPEAFAAALAKAYREDAG